MFLMFVIKKGIKDKLLYFDGLLTICNF